VNVICQGFANIRQCFAIFLPIFLQNPNLTKCEGFSPPSRSKHPLTVVVWPLDKGILRILSEALSPIEFNFIRLSVVNFAGRYAWLSEKLSLIGI
jgi:hypothetical protein